MPPWIPSWNASGTAPSNTTCTVTSWSLRKTSRSLMRSSALALGVTAPARAELRISDLDVFLNDQEVTVHVVLLGAVPDAFQEGIQGGIPTHVDRKRVV